MKAIKGLTVLFIFFFFSCRDISYNRVVTDGNISIRNKAILKPICDKYFPGVQPQYIHGKDSIIRDTFFTEPKIDLKRFLEENCKGANIDSMVLAIKLGIKTIIVQTDHYRVDTIITEDGKIITLLNDKLRASDKQVDHLTNLSILSNTKILKMRSIIIGLSLSWIILILIFLLRAYFKFKSKL